MNSKVTFVLVALLAGAFASCEAQGGNSTVIVPVPVYATLLDAELASCALRDQIGWLNQILAVEYVAQAYFAQLNNNLGTVNNTLLTASQFDGSVDDMKSNVTLIVNQLNEVISWLNSTINGYCKQLPNNTDDEIECYSFTRCNYTFGNLTGWNAASSSNSSATPAPTNSSSGNSTLPSNNSTSPAAGSNMTTNVIRALRQGVDFSDREAQYIIAMVPIVSNSTLQQQLALFSVLHGQHAAYLRGVSTHATEFEAPIVLSSSNSLQRSTLRSELLPYIADPDCCDGFRGLRRQ